MEQIIDVEFKEIEELEEESNEDLCKEVNLYWNQMELLGKLGFEFAARAGQRLNIIKGRLHHGEWENWCKNNLIFSSRKANRMMKLAEKMEDENSLFFKSDNLADIGISKVWALLAAPEEVAEEMVNNPETKDLSVREFEEEIKRLKAENEEKSGRLEDLESEHREAEIKLKEMTETADRLAEEAMNLEQQLKGAASIEETNELKQELENLKEKLKKAKEDADSQRIVAVETARKQAEEKAKTELEEATRQLKENNQQAAREIDRLQKLAGGNTELAIFKVKSDQLQQDFNSCLASIADIETDNPEQAAKLRNALRTVMEKLIERIEE